MIPLTAEELAALVTSRDILERLGGNPLTGGGLCSGVADGIKLILKVSVLQDLTAIKSADNPLLEMQKLGMGVAATDLPSELGLTLAQAGPAPGKPFTPKSMRADDVVAHVDSEWVDTQCEVRHPNLGARCRLNKGHNGSHDSSPSAVKFGGDYPVTDEERDGTTATLYRGDGDHRESAVVEFAESGYPIGDVEEPPIGPNPFATKDEEQQ